MPIADVTVKLVHGSIKDEAVIVEAVEGAAPKGIATEIYTLSLHDVFRSSRRNYYS